MIPMENGLADAIEEAMEKAVIDLFKEHNEQFYYITLITYGEARPPFLSAWSKDALERAVAEDDDDPEDAALVYRVLGDDETGFQILKKAVAAASGSPVEAYINPLKKHFQ